MDLSILENKAILRVFLKSFNNFASHIEECLESVSLKKLHEGDYVFPISSKATINMRVEKEFILKLIEYLGIKDANPDFSEEDIAKYIAKEYLDYMGVSVTIDNSFTKYIFLAEAIDICFELCRCISVPERIIEMIIEEVND